MEKIKKPPFYKELENFLQNEYNGNNYTIIRIDYVGSIKEDDYKIYNFLVFAKDTDNSLLCYLDKLEYIGKEVEIVDSTIIDINILQSIKNLNLETIKVLYDRI